VLLSDGIYDLVTDKEIVDKERRLLNYLATNSDNIEQLKEVLFTHDIEDPQDDISVLLLTGGM
jgi:serine/threonine protein phosphatase PrpC